MMYPVRIIAGSLGLLAMLGGTAAAAGDPAAGRVLAETYCAVCHDISADGPFKTYPPSFSAIAAYRPPEQILGRVMFPAMHTGMPDIAFYSLDPPQIEDLISYILSVEKTWGEGE
jgi:mono/diheme cytochrome c family protein